jgi:gamma-glutamyl-gamma-aminobutyraldehyde dehydrogenase
VPPTSRLFKEEIFGPVATFTTFEDEEEAVRLANDTEYGLASSLHTKDLSTAHRLARRIRAGVVAVNCYSEGDLATPFGGFKQSGFFGRDKGFMAHNQYTEVKTVWLQL